MDIGEEQETIYVEPKPEDRPIPVEIPKRETERELEPAIPEREKEHADR